MYLCTTMCASQGCKRRRTTLCKLGLAATLLATNGGLVADLAWASLPVFVGGDAIGSDNSLTNGTGGFTATQSVGENLGQPAILVTLDGAQYLTEFRVTAFGVPNTAGALRFDQFEYQLDFWRSDAYFAGEDPAYSLELNDPLGVHLTSPAPSVVTPEAVFGNAGVLAGNANTYDLRFDLSLLLVDAHRNQEFQAPPPAGDWVIGFQSHHDATQSGTLRVAGSGAEVGPLPLFSRGDATSRGILGGQDADQISLRWGISLSATDTLPGDADGDDDIDATDFEAWNRAFGDAASGGLADTDFDGDSDGSDFLWLQRAFGADIHALSRAFGPDGTPDNFTFGAPVPEPTAATLAFALATTIVVAARGWRPRMRPISE